MCSGGALRINQQRLVRDISDSSLFAQCTWIIDIKASQKLLGHPELLSLEHSTHNSNHWNLADHHVPKAIVLEKQRTFPTNPNEN
jgi:hypothetical protein